MSNDDIDRAMQAVSDQATILKSSNVNRATGKIEDEEVHYEYCSLKLAESLLMELKEHRRQHGNL